MKRAVVGSWRWCVRRRKPLLLTVGVMVATAGGVFAIVRVAMLLWGNLDKMAGEDERAQITAVSILVSVIFGIGGLITLVLLIHRQVYQARHQRHLEKVAADNLEDAKDRLDQARDVAADTRHDAAEKRITELYMKAADQLGHASAAVRLAGLYALDRLGREHPAHRQVIIDVWCSYLRMPYTPTTPATGIVPIGADLTSPTTPAQRPHDDEYEVRLTAQTLIADHIRAPRTHDSERDTALPKPDSNFWGSARINLTGAHLIGLNFDHCHLTDARFDKATFTGGAGFDEASFAGGAWFDKASFAGYAGFREATFTGYAGFSEASFAGSAWFDKASFAGAAGFREASFAGVAGFDKARFTGYAGFDKARFTGVAGFREATFTGYAGFREATFTGVAGFREATFTGGAWFREATFTGYAGFCEARFTGGAWFDEATFTGYAEFREATFTGDTWFRAATFTDFAVFNVAIFTGDAGFDKATFRHVVLFGGVAGSITLGDARIQLVYPHALPWGWRAAAADDGPGRRLMPTLRAARTRRKPRRTHKARYRTCSTSRPRAVATTS
ncbi:pentapeptide repeat-containing protein [Phytomonospora sp. NPDC050363]|uniref:pentapeptide repeat-containing protein n=1 Tax=Phytomonospora sp. NPDC050363 TaxID=3155642 RepID=UPI0033CCC2FA